MTMLKQNKTLFFEEFLWKFDPGFPCRKSKVEFGETNCHVLGGVSRNMLLDPTQKKKVLKARLGYLTR